MAVENMPTENVWERKRNTNKSLYPNFMTGKMGIVLLTSLFPLHVPVSPGRDVSEQFSIALYQ